MPVRKSRKANGKANGHALGKANGAAVYPFRVGRSRTGLGIFAIEPIKQTSPAGHAAVSRSTSRARSARTPVETLWSGRVPFSTMAKSTPLRIGVPSEPDSVKPHLR